MPDPKNQCDPAVLRMKRLYGEDFYDLPYALQQIRIRVLDRQYERKSEFLDDLRAADWKRKYDKAFGKR